MNPQNQESQNLDQDSQRNQQVNYVEIYKCEERENWY